jgi:hypothetical protein
MTTEQIIEFILSHDSTAQNEILSRVVSTVKEVREKQEKQLEKQYLESKAANLQLKNIR